MATPLTVNDLVAAPAAPVAPAPAQSPTPQPGFLQEPLTPKDESKARIPDEVLSIPAFRAILEGSPPAVLITQTEFQADPSLAVIQSNVEPLLYSGFGFYQPKDGQSAVVYNSQFIDGNALKIADDKGQLASLAAPYSELKGFFDANIGEASVAAPAPSSQPMGSPAPAASQNKLTTARVNNLALGSPTSGPAPGQGRVLNNILKATV